MKKWIVAVIVPTLFAAVFAANAAEKDSKKDAGPVLNREMKSLKGETVDLSQYKGKVVLIVNTASECGLTKHYKGLEALHQKYKDKGLVVLGFPCNQFGGQEPGGIEEITTCTKEYGVTFPIFAKIDVKEDTADDLYKYLTAQDVKPKGKGEVSWNFEKFVIGRDGKLVARFAPPTEPESKEIVSTVETELEKKPN